VIREGEVKPNMWRMRWVIAIHSAVNSLHEAERRREAQGLLNEGSSCREVITECGNVCRMRGDHPGDSRDEIHHCVATPRQ
jgi:hypothetical protein